jgi:hypothetical protein
MMYYYKCNYSCVRTSLRIYVFIGSKILIEIYFNSWVYFNSWPKSKVYLVSRICGPMSCKLYSIDVTFNIVGIDDNTKVKK